MGETWIGIIIGVAISSILIKGEASLRHREENQLLKIENKILRTEREERKIRIAQNEADIRELKAKDKEREEQVTLCLDAVSKLTVIRNDLDLTTQIAAQRLLRQHLKLPQEDTYMSD
jgi:hypothetical protein